MSNERDYLAEFTHAMKWNFIGAGISLVLIVGWGIWCSAWPLAVYQIAAPLVAGAIAWTICLVIGSCRPGSVDETALASQGGDTYGQRR